MKSQSGVTKNQSEVTPVKGGWIKRDAATGRFMEVQSERGVVKASARSEAAAKEASSKRQEALKRLADR